MGTKNAGSRAATARAATVRACRVCGCTDAHACGGGCWWIGEDLCSRCGRYAVVIYASSHTAAPVKVIEETPTRYRIVAPSNMRIGNRVVKAGDMVRVEKALIEFRRPAA